MDQIDDAAEVTRLLTESALSMRKPVEESHGYCLNCREYVGRTFCDDGCRDDYEKFEEAVTRNGKE
jgi:hypothetical protein